MCEFCEHCEKELDEWDPAPLCQSCQNDKEWCEWRDETVAAVESLVAKHGWKIEQTGGWGKKSWYFLITKNEEEINLRISDHAILYASNNDISLVWIPGQDDHSICDLEKLLEKVQD